jgi:hypothetical protein
MPHIFEPDVIAAILRHMNDDHLVDREISSAEMVRFDGDGGTWLVATDATSPAEATIAWPGGSISERPAVRREIVALYDEACERLGVEPRPHS